MNVLYVGGSTKINSMIEDCEREYWKSIDYLNPSVFHWAQTAPDCIVIDAAEWEKLYVYEQEDTRTCCIRRFATVEKWWHVSCLRDREIDTPIVWKLDDTTPINSFDLWHNVFVAGELRRRSFHNPRSYV